jgi:dihydrofolate synthase/folylpolyglutamate synthase
LDLDKALHYLDEHINLEVLTGVAGRVEGLSLDRMRRVVEVLGDPQRDYPVIHLTGTNGKGSTARMISALLAAHDLSVGTYTSPHLEHITERISRNGEPIPVDEFAAVIGDLASLEGLMAVRPSYFELLTAAAFSWFSQVAVDVAVVEVGMLGRWDATNVADGQVAVVTNVGKDHTDGVGDWRRSVAAEKAGIVKPGSHLVLGETDPALRPLFVSSPGSSGPASVWVRDSDFGVVTDRLAIGGHVVDLRTPNDVVEDVLLPVHGAHQVDNAACAVAAVEAFFGRALHPDVVASAFAGLRLPGRFEVLNRGPLLILDGAHNVDGAAAAARTLADEFDVGAAPRRWVLGMLEGRDAGEMVDAFGVRLGDEVVCCTPPSPRGVPAETLASVVAARGATVTVEPDVGRAVEATWRAATAGAGSGGAGSGGADGVVEGVVMVTGSLYTVGAARTACRRLGLLG